MLYAFADLLFVKFHMFLLIIRSLCSRESFFHDFKSLFEVLFQQRCVINHVCYQFSFIIFILSFYNTYSFLEIISFSPKFSIKSQIFRKKIFKPIWWIKYISISWIHVLSIPKAPDTIKFLAHVPTYWVIVSFKFLG